MGNDFLYAKAPLIEVVTEVHWALQPLLAIPNAAIDPHFSILSENFAAQARTAGFGLLETLIPGQVPIEMFPHRPLFRYRRTATEWPIFQLGPGLLAINIVPPYGGWREYEHYITKGVEWLFLSYPLPKSYLKIEKLEVRYIDGFTKTHGLSNYLEFVKEELNIQIGVSPRLAELSKAPEAATMLLDMVLPAATPNNSSLLLKIAPGKVREEDAVIMELGCRTTRTAEIQNPPQIMEWMNSAHFLLRETFERITSDSLKVQIGPKTEI
jgi:uncharacterized protein (TIGR04255 family)